MTVNKDQDDEVRRMEGKLELRDEVRTGLPVVEWSSEKSRRMVLVLDSEPNDTVTRQA